MIRRNTGILFLVFVILLAGTLIWQRIGTEDELEITATPIDKLLLPQLDIGKMVSFTLQRADGTTLVLVRGENEQWELKMPASEFTDSASASTTLSQLVTINVMSYPNLSVDIGQLGLSPAEYRMLMEMEDGQELVMNVGKETPTGSGYYVLTPDRRIVIVGKFTLDSVLGMLDNPPILEPTATPTLEPTGDIEEELSTTPEVSPPPQ